MCRASDPRDKIFVFLGLAERGRGKSTLNHHIMKADYRLSVQEVYITAAALMLETAGLAVLSHVQNPSLTEVDSLPSWVPDFSVDLGRYHFPQDCLPFLGPPGKEFTSSFAVTMPSSRWAASRKQETAPFTITADNHLVLQGTMIDAISVVTSLQGCYFQRIAGLALGTAAHYLNNQGVAPTFTSYPSGHAETDRKRLLLRTSEDPDFPSISRIEAVWRTLTLDSFEGVCPAPARCGFGFSDWVSLHLERVHKAWEDSQTIEEKRTLHDSSKQSTTDFSKYFSNRMWDKFYSWAALDRDEVGGFYTLEEIHAIQEKRSRSKEGAGNPPSVDGSGFRYLPDARRLGQVSKRGMKHKGEVQTRIQDNNFTADEKSRLTAFESQMREVKHGRRMFRTRKGYLGMGSICGAR